MKNIFGVNVTGNKKNYKIDGFDFLTQAVSPELSKKLDGLHSEIDYINKKTKLPVWIDHLRSICLVCALLITSGLLKADVSLSEGYNNAKYLYFICAACYIIFIVLYLIEKNKSKKMTKTDQYSEYIDNEDIVLEEIFNQFGIPENCESIDTLCFRYKVKKDKIKRISFGLFEFINTENKAYIKDENLCLANLYMVLSIPLTSIKRINQRKTASFPNWNKKEKTTSKKFKKYKINKNSQQTYFAKYYSVLIEDPKGDFELFIPNYDIETFTQLTKVRTDE